MATGSQRGWLCARLPVELALFGMVGWISPLVPYASAQPGPTYVPCLDTMAVNSAAVSVVVIADLCTPTSCGQGSNVIVNAEEHLKGSSGAERSPGSRYAFQINAPATTLAGWKAGASRLLVFDHLGNDPLSANQNQKVIDLSAHDLRVLTAEMGILRGPEQILEATRKAIGRHLNVYAMLTFSRSIPAEIAHELGVTFWPKTTVPADSDLEQWALSALNSREDSERSEAANALGYFPSEDNAYRLKRLLDDPALSNNGPGNVNIYFVRADAYRSLIRMGVTVPKPLLEKKPEQP
jgi:hypothetical protein